MAAGWLDVRALPVSRRADTEGVRTRTRAKKR